MEARSIRGIGIFTSQEPEGISHETNAFGFANPMSSLRGVVLTGQEAMTEQIPHPHTPEQERLLSNIGHWVEGGIITAGGALLMRDAFEDRDPYGDHASKVLAGAGAFLGVGLVAGSFHHGGPVTFFRLDRQQRQHLEMAGLLTAGSLASRFRRIGRLLSGASTARIGQMFLVHEQHGTGWAERKAWRRHRRLGKTILAAAATRAVGDLLESRWIRGLGAGLLVASGLQLLTYKEPEGAFERTGDGNAEHSMSGGAE
jgi:hypothetical protein